MKKLCSLLLLVPILAFGCALDSERPLSPPAWIRGEWSTRLDPAYDMKMVFTDDNTLYGSPILSIDFAEDFCPFPMDGSVENDRYSVSVSNGGHTLRYVFELKSSDALELTETYQGTSLSPLTLKKPG